MGLRFVVEGREYEYDRKLSVEDAMFIYEKSQVGVNALNHALLVEANPNVIAAWIYLMKRRAGEAVRWQDILKLDLSTYNVIADEPDDESSDESEGEEAKEQADPTPKPGATRRLATTST